jgi:integrase
MENGLQMNKQNLTANRVSEFACEAGKQQSFLWDSGQTGLGVRATANGAKSYIFQSVHAGKTIRITIGSPDARGVPEARLEARRLQQLIDQGVDPREQKAEQQAKDKAAREAREAAREAERLAAARNALRVADAWQAYIDYQREYMRLDHIEPGKKWGERHLADHIDAAQPGGQQKKRGKGLTVQGVLYPVLQMRLADVNAAVLTKWQRKEAAVRANKARQGFSMFRAFWRWCASHNEYRAIIDPQAVEAQAVRSEVPSRKSKKFDVMERAHLAPWFDAVRKLSNPVASAYLQTLLLTGARREELAGLRWEDVDFRWNVMWLDDKVEADGRKVPLTPYVATLLDALPRRNEWVFSSTGAKSGADSRTHRAP